MKKLFFLPILFLISCANNNHNSRNSLVDLQNMNEIVRNPDNILQKETIGKNQISSSIWIDKNNNLVKQYSFTQRQNSFMSYIPIISLFLPRIYHNYEVIITFDKKSKKIWINDFFNNSEVSSGFFCNPPAFSCMAKIH